MSDEKKYTRGKNPNSIKNLKPIAPGEVRNPLGGKAHTEDVKSKRKLTNQFLKELIEISTQCDLEELQKIAQDPKSTVAELMVARCLHKAIKDQDWALFDRIIERLIGKVPQVIDNTSSDGSMKTVSPIELVVVDVKKDESQDT